MKRVQHILETENVKSNDDVVATLIGKFFPDWRRTLNELQRYSATGQIDSGILVNLSDSSIQRTYHLSRIKSSRILESGLFIIWTTTLVGYIVGFMIVYMIVLHLSYSSLCPHTWIILISLPFVTKKLISHLSHRDNATSRVQVMYELKEYLYSINLSKDNLMDSDDEVWEKKYLPSLSTNVLHL